MPAHASVAVDGVSATTDVRCVSGRRLAISTVSGNVHIEANPAKASVASVSGNLHLRLDSSKIHAETVSGDLDLQGRMNGEVSIEPVSGHIMLRGETPRIVNVSTVSANAELRTGLHVGRQLQAESTSGDLTLIAPAGSSLRLDASSFSGRIHFDSGTIQDREHGHGVSLQTRVGRGDASVVPVKSN